MKKYNPLLVEKQNDIAIGDTLLIGKFKNRKAVVKGFSVDKKTNQPLVVTNKGTIPLYKFRIQKLMPDN